jgi:hypothetical protein
MFTCPESESAAEVNYWCSLFEWIGCPAGKQMMDMPAIDCDALLVIKQEMERIENAQRFK